MQKIIFLFEIFVLLPRATTLVASLTPSFASGRDTVLWTVCWLCKKYAY